MVKWMHKLITTTGFGGTGSSAITDILKEFSNVLSKSDQEIWLYQDLWGISDLEYYLLEGSHRSKTSYAIKKFKVNLEKNSKQYFNYFGQGINNIISEYVEGLSNVKFKKAESIFEVESKVYGYFLFKLIPKFISLRNKLFNLNAEIIKFNYPLINKSFFVPNYSFFYGLTKQMSRKLVSLLDPKMDFEFIVIDQLIPATNYQRYFNYFDNIKIVIVDRDPRDLYLLNEVIWRKAPFVADTSNVEEFVKWFRAIRIDPLSAHNSNNVLRIQFEDLIYSYEDTLAVMLGFLGINHSNHIYKFKFFNPEKSKINTRLWVGRNDYKVEIEYIEKHLKEFCF